MNNYEERYKQIESILRDSWKSLPNDIKNRLLSVEPQLLDSEDEILRKQILELVRKHSVNSDRTQMENWLYRHANANHKFEVGDIIEYRSERYKIFSIEEVKHGHYYKVLPYGNIKDPEEIKTAIGPGGENDMHLIRSVHWTDKDELNSQKIAEILRKSFEKGESPFCKVLMLDTWLINLQKRV